MPSQTIQEYKTEMKKMKSTKEELKLARKISEETFEKERYANRTIDDCIKLIENYEK